MNTITFQEKNIQQLTYHCKKTYLEQGAAASDVHTQIAGDVVVGLCTILHKIGMARDIIGNVVAHLKGSK